LPNELPVGDPDQHDEHALRRTELPVDSIFKLLERVNQLAQDPPRAQGAALHSDHAAVENYLLRQEFKLPFRYPLLWNVQLKIEFATSISFGN
jgi:hypothetical protein